MKEFIAKLSANFSRLSSAERWFIIITIIVVFAVVNFWFVIPHLEDWGKLSTRMDDARAKQKKYEEAISGIPALKKQIAALEGENSSVPQEDQSVNFLTAIQNQAVQSGVSILVNNRQPERTNQFFLERAQSLTTQSGEQQLVDFLYNLGAGSSLIRVRALSIGPDAGTRQQLSATITLIASFQKKPPVKAKPAPAATPAKSVTPAVSKDTSKPANKPATSAVPPANKPSTPTKK